MFRILVFACTFTASIVGAATTSGSTTTTESSRSFSAVSRSIASTSSLSTIRKTTSVIPTTLKTITSTAFATATSTVSTALVSTAMESLPMESTTPTRIIISHVLNNYNGIRVDYTWQVISLGNDTFNQDNVCEAPVIASWPADGSYSMRGSSTASFEATEFTSCHYMLQDANSTDEVGWLDCNGDLVACGNVTATEPAIPCRWDTQHGQRWEARIACPVL